MRIAFATASVVGGDVVDDDRHLAAAFARAGHEVVPLPWDDPAAPTGDVAAVILRSVWNYHRDLGAFLAWLRAIAAGTQLFNPYALVAANAEKSYLLGLVAAGVPIVPTEVVACGARADLAAIARAHAWPAVVVKPSVSASSDRTLLVGAHGADFAAGQRHLDALTAAGAALVQPFVREVLAMGERSLVFFDGQFSHAIEKEAFNPIDATVALPIDPTARELAVARAALATLAEVPLYARVDLVARECGGPQLMELELIEPELYFRCCAPAGERFVEAFERRMAESSGKSRTLCP